MDRKFYKMLETVGDKAKDAVIQLEKANGDKLVAAGLAEIVAGDPTGGNAEVIKELAELQTKQVREAVELAVRDTLPGMIKDIATESGKAFGKHIQIHAGEAEADKSKSQGDFFQCIGVAGVLNDSRRQDAIERLEKVYQATCDPTFAERFAKSQAAQTGMSYKAALAESAGVTGGYTVPPQYATDLLALSAEHTVLLGKTDDYPMTGRELVMPVLDQTTAPSSGNPAWFGGVVANWTGEAATRTETEPKFKELKLVANELSGYALASRNVLADNVVALEKRLTQQFAGAIGWYRDYAYLRGDGVAKPQGILNANASISVTRQTASNITYIDITAMLGNLLPSSLDNAIWVCSQTALPNILQMTDPSGRLLVETYANPNGGAATMKPVRALLGTPLVATEKLPALGTKGDLMLIDPKQYFTGTRSDIEIAASEHYKFLNNQVTYRFLFRGDGRSWLDAAFTYQDTTTTVSPFVVLN